MPKSTKAARPRRPASKALTRLQHGYSLAVTRRATDDVLSLQSADGRMVLRLVLTQSGPLLEVQSQALSVSTRGPLRFDCQSLEINAEKDVAIRSALGDIKLHANDDVCLDGERVRLNSPRVASPVPPTPLARRK
jgi:hypothetical protein